MSEHEAIGCLLVAGAVAAYWGCAAFCEYQRRRAVDRKYEARMQELDEEKAAWEAWVRRELADLNRPTRTLKDNEYENR